MQKSLGTLITIVKYFCGPDVSLYVRIIINLFLFRKILIEFLVLD